MIEKSHENTQAIDIYHATVAENLNARAVISAVAELAGLRLAFGQPRTEDEIKLDKRLEVHKLYLEYEWWFDRHNLEQSLALPSKDPFNILNAMQKIVHGRDR